jgi:regulator of cell morphogenesis and NO signaling
MNGQHIMHTDPNETIGDIVAADYRTAEVFDRYGLDFCCGGRRTLSEACREQGVGVEDLLRSLDELATGSDPAERASTEWPLDTLIDYIVSWHHGYVKSAIPVLTAYTTKIAEVHGERSPELRRVAELFANLASELTQHMAKEEGILFPYVRSLLDAARANGRMEPSPFGTVHNPIRMLEGEHQEAGDEMRLIRELTHGYALPDFACATYRACFDKLQEFEQYLHEHVHLENNILFPAAIRLEESCTSR